MLIKTFTFFFFLAAVCKNDSLWKVCSKLLTLILQRENKLCDKSNNSSNKMYTNLYKMLNKINLQPSGGDVLSAKAFITRIKYPALF